MSQRLRGISDAEATGAVKEIFDSSNQLLGRTANLVRILSHSPYLARWFCRWWRRYASPMQAPCPMCACAISPC